MSDVLKAYLDMMFSIVIVFMAVFGFITWWRLSVIEHEIGKLSRPAQTEDGGKE